MVHTDINSVPSSEIGLAGTIFISSLDLFRVCCDIVDKSDWKVTTKKAFRNELESYLLWGNYYNPGSGLLDRLVSASSEEFRDGVLAYIGNICQLLCRRLLALPECSQEQWQTDEPVKNRLEVFKLLDRLDDIGIQLESYVFDEDSIDYVVEDLKSNIDLLHELVPTLDDIGAGLEARDDVASSASTDQELELSGPASHYCRMIKDRFPLLNVLLVERLGIASWERHNRVRTHISCDGNKSAQLERQDDEEPTEFHDSGIGTTLNTVSQYASSQASYQSFMSSRADIEGGHTRLPPLPPRSLSSKAFSCTVCGSSVRDVNNKVQWRHHVYSDLQAYSCVVTDCDTLKSFTSRGEFAAHLTGAHRFVSQWHCKSCGEIKSNKADFERHIKSAHPSFPRPYVEDIIKVSEERVLRDLEHEQCPFCGKTPTSSRFVGHVAHHLEELSLSAIPHEVESDPEECSTTSGTVGPYSAPEDMSLLKLEVDLWGRKGNVSSQQEEGRFATAKELYESEEYKGFAPQPSVNPKRPHELLPQTTRQRPLALNSEVLDVDESPVLLSNAIPHHSTHGVKWDASMAKSIRISKAKKGKKVHQCEYSGCEKVYTRREHLRRHMANHNVESLFRCEIEGCRKPFHRADLLARHCERQHGIRYLSDATIKQSSADKQPFLVTN